MRITGDELRKVQLVELRILKELHRICVKHNIKYFLSDGTLIGAVRHGG
ncbi:MAG: LicD family protein, partial [Treponema sp.]|nr:LicD family protein [Treponema sp.]